ncbi:hypothetical protein RvY_11507 [Ramazzottius varieornatus]|uniref:Uncharacterized protein n=1 Tax=Ramazzottius varieornatus TaxID=947166 RepID=A0A1D1VP40_RAMVA|nr:hypothetical protein RvY_11507 [Ramazzottius varieornatus]
MGLAVKGLFWLGPFGLLQCVSVWGQGLQCYDCDGQTMGIPTDDCWTNFNASTRVRITEATDPTKCLVCYTEIIDVMINATTRSKDSCMLPPSRPPFCTTIVAVELFPAMCLVLHARIFFMTAFLLLQPPFPLQMNEY